MQNKIVKQRINQFDAAIYLLCLITVSDGKIKKEEISAIDQEFELMKLFGLDDIKKYQISNWELLKENLNKLSALSDQNSIIDSFNDLSDMVFYSDLKEQVVHSAINIAYSDYEYHPNEKQLIDILKNKWSD